ncbi:MAG: Gx transporter family protein [Agathobacter sp.]|nr:Gx transporter family protein [Agathobacter sp.]
MKKKVAYLGLFLGLALVCSYLESLVPIGFGIPGIKLGLTNVVVVLLMYCIGAKEALIISLLRIFLMGCLFNPASIPFSLAGGLLSFILMYLMKRTSLFKCLSVSVVGGISHNIGQIIVASVIVENYNILFYIPVLLVAGIITGFLIGIVSQEIIIRLENSIHF